MYKPHLSLNDIYVSPLKPLGNGLYDLMTEAELQAIVLPQTQCLLMDELAKALLRVRRFRVDEVALLVGIPARRLSVCVSVMFGCSLNKLIEDYQQRLLLELTRSTQLPPDQVAARAGFLSQKSMYNHFTRFVGDSFFDYRSRHQRRTRTIDDKFKIM